MLDPAVVGLGQGCLVQEESRWMGVDLGPQLLSAPLSHKDSGLYQLPQSLLRKLYDSRSVSLEGLLKVLSKASAGRRRLWRGKRQRAGL